jgi:hypothetical protein
MLATIGGVYVSYGNQSANEYIRGQFCSMETLWDPAGYVYEAVESNRVEGVTTTLYEAEFYKDADGNIIEEDGNEGGEVNEITRKEWVDIDTENPQLNGQLTDSDGKYAYQVGLGAYQVEFSKDGYETRWNNSDTLHDRNDNWLIVPPEQTEVNVGIRSKATPKVVGAGWVEDAHGQKYIVVNIDQYMNVATLKKSAGNVTIKVNGNPTDDFGITFSDGEKAAADDEISSDRFYAKTMEIWVPDEATGLPGSFEDGDVVEITISGNVTNYRDYKLSELGEDWTETIVIGGVVETKTLEVTAPDFEAVKVGYSQPAAQEITIENRGNSTATISSVTVSPNEAFTISGSGTTVEAGETIQTWTIQPKAGLAKGIYNAQIRVAYDDSISLTATANVRFEVEDSVIIISPDVGEKEVVYGGNYIAGLDAGSDGITTAALTSALTVEDGYTTEIVGKDGNEVTGKIGTGMTLQVKDENGVIIETFTLVVKYDVTGAGKAGLNDIFAVLDYSVGNEEFDDAQKLAIRGNKTGLSLIFDMIDYAVGNQ